VEFPLSRPRAWCSCCLPQSSLTVSALRADVWADLIAWAATTGPLFVIHHLLLRRHVTKVTRKQTGHIDQITADQTRELRSSEEGGSP
jgi:hypothetical protein